MSTDVSSSPWPSRLEWGIIAAFWGTFALLSVAQGLFGDGDEGVHWGRMAGELVEYGTWVLVTPLVFRLVEALPVVETLASKEFTATRNISLHALTALVFSITVDLSEDLVSIAATPDSDATFELLRPIRNLWFMDEFVVYLVVLMAGFARSYYFQKKARQEEAERLEERTQALEAQLTEARLAALRMQLNPHFLFNTLHAVSTLVDRKPDGVRRMIARLSELLRHVLDEDAPQEVPLSQELDFLDDYLEIQTIRFQGRLDVDINVPSSLRDAQVPNLILQPLVENAIKHGASQVRGKGRIEICAERSDDQLVVRVRDNGPGPSTDAEEGLGLRNVRARLKELYGDNQSLLLTATEAGTVAQMSLPYHTSTDLYAAAGSASPLARTAGDGLPD
ncbi:MAG: sensor histidine kinase [Salinivenus sp.]